MAAANQRSHTMMINARLLGAVEAAISIADPQATGGGAVRRLKAIQNSSLTDAKNDQRMRTTSPNTLG